MLIKVQFINYLEQETGSKPDEALPVDRQEMGAESTRLLMVLPDPRAGHEPGSSDLQAQSCLDDQQIWKLHCSGRQ